MKDCKMTDCKWYKALSYPHHWLSDEANVEDVRRNFLPPIACVTCSRFLDPKDNYEAKEVQNVGL